MTTVTARARAESEVKEGYRVRQDLVGKIHKGRGFGKVEELGLERLEMGGSGGLVWRL